jgi:superfamily II DNA helicase RecQ
LAPFRECYGRLHELRSLVNTSINFICVTATATKDTKDVIVDLLGMKKPHEISECPEKPNMTYVVEQIPRDADIKQYFTWLVMEAQDNGMKMERTIIYCQTIHQCSVVYAT